MFLKYTNRLRYLVLAIFSHLIAPLPPEEPRDMAFNPSVFKRLQRWRVS